MNFSFVVVDEARLPREAVAGLAPEAVAALIRERGGPWTSVKADPAAFDDAFATLDRFVDGRGFLPTLADAGSPHLVLTGHPGDWRLGYFEASLVPHLDGAFRILSDEIAAAFAPKDAPTRDVERAFRSALEEAAGRGFAVAVLHG